MRNVRRFVVAVVCGLALAAVVVVTGGIQGSGQPVAGIQGTGVVFD